MARSNPKKESKSPARPKTAPAKELAIREPEDAAYDIEPHLHIYGPKAVCDTDTRGFATPNNRSPLELVVDASEGFIPLWAPGVTLRWRFQERSMQVFRNPDGAKAAIRTLFGDALLAWGGSAPVRFAERADVWDFEIAVRAQERCSPSGCTLASAFFPDSGRHELVIYPTMFQQSRKEMVDTLIHEIGHVFGLRHFFADVRERAWPVEIFGEHRAFSIMNYGAQSELTEQDKSDLTLLYQRAWSGQMTEINGTPIELMRPFSASRFQPDPCARVA